MRSKARGFEAHGTLSTVLPGLMIVAGRYVPMMRFAVNASMGLSDIPYRRFLLWYDPEGIDGLVVAVFCPPCAAAEFGHRPEVAASYVCVFQPPDPSLPTSV